MDYTVPLNQAIIIIAAYLRANADDVKKTLDGYFSPKMKSGYASPWKRPAENAESKLGLVDKDSALLEVKGKRPVRVFTQVVKVGTSLDDLREKRAILVALHKEHRVGFGEHCPIEGRHIGAMTTSSIKLPKQKR